MLRRAALTDLLAAAGVFFLLLGIYLFTHGGDFFVSDGVVMWRTTEAIVDRHTVALAPDPGLSQIVPGRDGKYYSKYGLGQPLAAIIPLKLARWIHPKLFEYMYYKGVEGYALSLFNQGVTALTGLVVYLFARRLGFDVRLSLALTLAWGLSTLAWPYAKTFFSEPLFTLCLTVAAFALLAYQQTTGWRRLAWLALAGSALGYAVLTRPAGFALLPAYALYLLWTATTHDEGEPVRVAWLRVRQRRAETLAPLSHWLPRSLGALAAFGLPLAACIALVLWHNWVRFGSAFNNGYGDESFDTPLPVGLAGLLVSPGKSIVLYVPLVALAVVGWRQFWRAERATAALFTAICVITLLQSAVWWAWWGGWCWGPRFLVPALPFLMLGLGPLLARSRAAWRAFWPLAALGSAVALLGVLIDFNPYLAEVMPRHPGKRPGTEDPMIYFDPALSPLRAHARDLLHWEHTSVITFDLERLGFGARVAQVFPFIALAIGCLGLALIVAADRMRPRALPPPDL